MLTCPGCGLSLEKGSYHQNQYWECPSCGGRAIAMDTIEKTISPAFARQLWDLRSSDANRSDSYCVVCNKKAAKVIFNKESETGEAVICQDCRFAWFELAEFEYLSRMMPEPDVNFKPSRYGIPSSQSEPSREKVLREKFEDQYDYGGMIDDSPDRWWHYVLSFLGFPAVSGTKAKELPIATWSLAIIMVIVALFTFPHLDTVVKNWSLIPAEHTRHYGLTFITSFFLHGGIMHLVGNLYFLLMFGRRVEGVLYIDRYLLLVALAALIGNIVHIVFDQESYRGLIGASGGISGILTYYCLSFPKAEVRIFFFFTWIRLSVVWFFFFWILEQSLGAMAQIGGFGNVSFLAHIGGSAVGFAFWYIIVRPKRLKKARW